MKELILSKNQVAGLAEEVAGRLTSEEKTILCLKGNLGAGKTFFASRLVQALTGDVGVKVVSPTFNLVNVYKAKSGQAISHFDLYRLKTLKELEDIGFFDSILTDICIIEWWNIFEGELKNFLQDAIFINIINTGTNQRKFIYV